jgi:signal transduction histidine kinase
MLANVLPKLWQRDPIQAQEQVTELETLTRTALDEIRTLLYELHPEALTQIHLDKLLRGLAASSASRSGAHLATSLAEAPHLEPDVQIALYRISQEALRNAMQYSGATHLSLELDVVPGGIALWVRDDGRGFDPAAVPHDRFGIRFMRARAESIDAAFSLRSQPGQGTEIHVIWPAEVGS